MASERRGRCPYDRDSGIAMEIAKIEIVSNFLAGFSVVITKAICRLIFRNNASVAFVFAAETRGLGMGSCQRSLEFRYTL